MSIRNVLALLTTGSIFFGHSVFAQDDNNPNPQISKVGGVVIAKHKAALSVDIKARVTKIPFQVGDAFRKGDMLLAFDCDVQKAESAAAYAAFIAAKTKHKSNVEMETHKAVGRFEVELSKAEKDEAAAVWNAAKGKTKYCVIKAPFDGRVAELSIHEHEMPNIEQPLITIIGNQEMELHFVAPSKWLTWLSVGTPFVFHIDETNQEYPAKVERIGAEVDPVSGTVDIFGIFSAPVSNVLSGMRGTAMFTNLIP